MFCLKDLIYDFDASSNKYKFYIFIAISSFPCFIKTKGEFISLKKVKPKIKHIISNTHCYEIAIRHIKFPASSIIPHIVIQAIPKEKPRA